MSASLSTQLASEAERLARANRADGDGARADSGDAGASSPEATRRTGVTVKEFEALLDRYETPLLRYVRRVIGRGGEADAEDVVQETFLRLHKEIRKNGAAGIKQMTTWLYRVAYTRAIDVGRKRTRQRNAHDGYTQQVARPASGDHGADGAQLAADREAGRVAMDEVDRLPDQLRDTVLLKVIEGMTMKQIGEVMDTSPSNVCYRLKQAMQLLGQRLEEQGVV